MSLGLKDDETEAFANKAGLSLFVAADEDKPNGSGGLQELLADYNGSIKYLVDRSMVSERMLEYYKNGKKPTKQAILAILIALDCTEDKITRIMRYHGFCLSKSIPGDVVTL